MPKLNESTTAIIVRSERVGDGFASEPYEAGWAKEAVVFLTGHDSGPEGSVVVQISPDGMAWADEGSTLPFPPEGQVAFARLVQFGNWLRLRVTLPHGTERRLMATLNLKA